MTATTDIEARDEASGSLWFTGPASFTAQAARDRRTLLVLLRDASRLCPECDAYDRIHDNHCRLHPDYDPTPE
jgi:hypothetical protein